MWQTPWATTWEQLYKELTGAESTIATHLRIEAIGLNAFLARAGVPGISPSCECGARSETPKHAVIFCPNKNTDRAEMQMEAGTSDYNHHPHDRKGPLGSHKVVPPTQQPRIIQVGKGRSLES